MRYAYLTCELLGRDLDSRLLIASHLLKRGVSCVVGQQWSMFEAANRVPPAVFLLKTANMVQGRAAQGLRKCGHKVVISDEEVLAIADEGEIAAATHPLALDNSDLFLALDERHKRIVETVGSPKIEVVGNARVELLTKHADIYADEVAAIQKPYIVFNTGFAAINSVWGANAAKIILMVREIPEHKAKAFLDEAIAFEQANYAIMVELIAWARDTLDRRIVVRPHPAERAQTWDIPGVEIVAKTNPIPWMLGADAVVHCSSTTGLEAALLGVPCLNICPMLDTRLGQVYAVKDFNPTVKSLGAAKTALQALVTAPRECQRLPYTTEGATLTAAAMARLAPETEPLTEWTCAQRHIPEIEKFSIGDVEFTSRARKFTDAPIQQIDDSLFLMQADPAMDAGVSRETKLRDTVAA